MTKVAKTKAAKKTSKTAGVKAPSSNKAVTSVKVTVRNGKSAVTLGTQKKAAAKTPARAEKKTAEKAPHQKTASKAVEAPEKAVEKQIVEKKVEKLDFVAGDFVVYPAHGVGQVEGVEEQTIAGLSITLYTICFEKDRMRLKLPVTKVKASGLRKLSSKDRLKDALSTLQGRSQVRRIMWSRRAQEYEAKINSGDPVSIAEVLRDLKKADDQGEQSYSERQIYQAALARLAREVAAIEKIDEKKAAEKLEAVLGNVA